MKTPQTTRQWQGRTDRMEWSDRWELIQRLVNCWLAGGETPLAERLRIRIQLDRCLGNTHRAVVHPEWQDQRMTEAKR